MPIEDINTIVTLVVFVVVILVIALDLTDMVLATLLGVSVLIAFGIFNVQDVLNITRTADGPIALLFGGMVVARTLKPTGLFDYIGTRYLLLTRGSGKRFLLGLILLVAPLCAVLPNATTVVLLAPIIVRVAVALEVDFVGPMVLTAIISNAAGLLTLVGDPATFLVGSGIGMTFVQYLQKVSLGGLLSVLVVIPFLPWLMRDVWNVRRTLPADLKAKPLERPWLCTLSLLVLALIVLLFIFGENIPSRIVPPAAAIVGAALALLVTYGTKVEPVSKVLEDVDWKTLVFLICLFCLVEAINKTGILQSLSHSLHSWFGVNLVLVAMAMLVFVGFTSSLLANVPVVAAMLLMVKSYSVIAELVPEQALDPTFTAWPANLIPVFVAMMFAGTLGGNATLIGSSANVVAVAICAANGKRVSFMQFLRYGLPVTLVQLAVSALYVLGLFYFTGR
jgi:Na+/H+ antiporter NhaD/arsenite permease-like protein